MARNPAPQWSADGLFVDGSCLATDAAAEVPREPAGFGADRNLADDWIKGEFGHRGGTLGSGIELRGRTRPIPDDTGAGSVHITSPRDWIFPHGIAKRPASPTRVAVLKLIPTTGDLWSVPLGYGSRWALADYPRSRASDRAWNQACSEAPCRLGAGSDRGLRRLSAGAREPKTGLPPPGHRSTVDRISMQLGRVQVHNI